MSAPFPPTSRYAVLPTTTLEEYGGRVVRYVTRRLLPQPEELALLQTHTVTEGERLDNITARYLADAEQFWRVADANRAMRPDDLVRTGQLLRITLPAGVPGAPNA